MQDTRKLDDCFGLAHLLLWILNPSVSEGESTYTSQQVKKKHVIAVSKPSIQALPMRTYLITRKLAFYFNGRLIKNIQNWLGGCERRQRRLLAPENLSQFSKPFKLKHLLVFTGWGMQHSIMKFLHSEEKNHRYFPWKFPFWFLSAACYTRSLKQFWPAVDWDENQVSHLHVGIHISMHHIPLLTPSCFIYLAFTREVSMVMVMLLPTLRKVFHLVLF